MKRQSGRYCIREPLSKAHGRSRSPRLPQVYAECLLPSGSITRRSARERGLRFHDAQWVQIPLLRPQRRTAAKTALGCDLQSQMRRFVEEFDNQPVMPGRDGFKAFLNKTKMGDRHERPTGRVRALPYSAGQGSLSSLPLSHITIRGLCQISSDWSIWSQH